MASPLGFSPDTFAWVPLTQPALGFGTAALQNIGTSGANVPLLSTANTWSLAQTFSAASIFTQQTFGSTVGEKIALYGALSAASSFVLGIESATLYFRSASTFRWYSNVLADAGVSDIMELSSTALTVQVPANINALTTMRVDALNAAATVLWLRNNTAGAAGTEVIIDMTPSTNAIGVRSAQLVAYAISNSQAGLKFRISNASAPADALTIPNTGGLVVGNPSGGDVGGTGRLNAVALYEAGVALVSKYGALATVNTWALAQTFTTAPVFTNQSGTRTALGLGTAATQNTGTSGANVPLMNGVNSWSATQTFTNIKPTAIDTIGNVDFDMGPSTADAADSNRILLRGGGAFSSSRGAYLTLSGNENATSPGQVNLVAGAGASLTLNSSGGALIFNGTTVSTFGLSLLDDADQAAAQATLGLSSVYGQLAVANTWTASQTISLGGNAALIISKGTDTSNAIIDLQKAGSLRWRIACETTAESGGNAGSDFVIMSRDDAGAAIATALKITRSTGVAAFSTQGTFGGYPVEWSGYNARPSDADHTLTVLSSAGTYEKFTGTLTAARQVTLSTTGAIAGNKFFITRTGGGAFNLNIGTGPLKALAQNQWCIVVYDGTAWYLAAFGSL